MTPMAQQLLDLQIQRQHIGPKRLSSPALSDQALQDLLRAAAQAPDHGRIRPWRFVLVPPQRRHDLGQAFVQALRERDPQASASAQQAASDKALRAPCLMLAIVDHRESSPPIPLQERLISLGCAIQNMLLMAQALGLGSGLTSGQAVNAPAMRKLFGLRETEEGICFLNFGHITQSRPPQTRPAVSDFFSTLPEQT